MLKKALIGVLGVLLVGSIVLFLWARSVLAHDGVRTEIAGRLSQALGQPVSIGGIGASIYPRVTVNLDNLSIGPQANIRVGTLGIGTDFRALLSRRIEHGSMRLTGARIQLPLPVFASPSPADAPPPATRAAPVEIVSIDEIVLSGVEIVSGARTLRGDIELVPQGSGVLVRKVSLRADDATINITGRIADLSGPTGELSVKAGALDFSRLLAFVSDFSAHAGLSAGQNPAAPASARASASTRPSTMNLAVTMEADRATLGTLAIEKLSGRARITSDGMTLDPIAFGVFGGRYEGSLALTLGEVPDFRLRARLSSIDMTAATRFAGSPNTITGQLSGDIDVAGRGLEASRVAKSARGTVRMNITNGVVKNLGLIQAVVVATSMRSGALSQGSGSRDEPFTRLGGTLTLANGEGTTQNLQFESKDVSLGAAGAVRLDGTVVDLKGRAQLSEALSQQAGSDLLRYTQEQGRVTLPATIGGSVENLRVRIDAADLAKRAVRNRATDEAQKAVKGLGNLLKR
ncbi:MAG TPA: AsmA-like C-terminal region-containing protein [Vicinamibacterales bacterium]|jgi:uncharacterized protein involved in outer membrane biogenesis|nr:AsmA-like C-terminal region-containing protein [Vicinamibacterales bacterium]